MLNLFYRTVSGHYRPGFLRLYALQLLLVFLLFFVAWTNGMQRNEYFEFMLFMIYRNTFFVAVYSALSALLLLQVTRWTEYISMMRIKEFALRMNNWRRLFQCQVWSIVLNAVLVTVLYLLPVTALSFLLEGEMVSFGRLLLSVLLYAVWYGVFALAYFLLQQFMQNILPVYLCFILLHCNNVFSFFRPLSLCYVLSEGTTVQCLMLAAGGLVLGLAAVFCYQRLNQRRAHDA